LDKDKAGEDYANRQEKDIRMRQIFEYQERNVSIEGSWQSRVMKPIERRHVDGAYRDPPDP